MKWGNRHRACVAGVGSAGLPTGGSLAAGLPVTAQTWPEFWAGVQPALRARGYQRSSLNVVRQVLRGLARASAVPPSDVRREHIEAHLRRLTARRCSASWLAMNISILRTVFDKVCGRDLLTDRIGPKRPDTLPRILSRHDVKRLLRSAADFRELVLLELLYGCGLKLGEACALRWADVLADAAELRVGGSGSTRARVVRIPLSLRNLLLEGRRRFSTGSWVFRGRTPRRALSTRSAERLLHHCARRAGLARRVTSMTLRHAHAVHALDDGLNVRELQVRLGHTSIDTTMRYQRCRAPAAVTSPLDAIEAPIPRSVAHASGRHPASAGPRTTFPRRLAALPTARVVTWIRARLGRSPS